MSSTYSADKLNFLRAQLEAGRTTVLGADWRSSGGASPAFKPSSLLNGISSGASSRAPLQHQPHASLLATPASRHKGGRLTAHPSSTTLNQYEQRLEASVGYSRGSDGSSLAGFSPAPAARFTPRDPSPLRQQQHQSAWPLTGAANSLPRKPSLLDQHAAATWAKARGGSNPQAAYSPASADIDEQLRQLQVKLSHQAAANSAVITVSRDAGTSPRLARNDGLRPSQQQQQQQQQADFRISAAFPSSRGAAGMTPSATCGRDAGAGALPADAQQQQEQQDEYDEQPVAVSMRLTPMFEAISVDGGGQQQQWEWEQQAALQLPASAADWSRDHSPHQQAAARKPPQQQQQHEQQPTWPQAGGDAAAWRPVGGPSTALLASRVNELEAQLQMERMRSQEAAATTSELRQELERLRQAAQHRSGAAEAAQQRAAEAEARLREAAQQTAALQEDLQRRQSVHSESMESVARLTAVSQHHRHENEELRQKVQQLNEAWEQENKQVAQLQRQLQTALAAAGNGEGQVVERLRTAEAEWERRVSEAREAAQAEVAELASRCHMLSVQRVAHEQAARQAVAQRQMAEERCEVAEARCRKLAADLGAVESDVDAQGGELAEARRQAAAAGEAARQARQQLMEQQRRCEELEAELAGELERSSSIARRAETAEVAQQGLGSHVKATHVRLQQLQEQLAAAQREARQLQGENEEMRQVHLSHQSSLELHLSSAQTELAEVRQERDQLRQRLSKANADLDAQLQAAGHHRQQVAALQQAEREARAALERQGSAAAQQGQKALALQAHAEALETRVAQLEGDLHGTRQQLAAAEDRLAKAARAPGGGASPLREVVGGLRLELQEKDLQLMQMHEDLSKERARTQELQQQVLDQAVELDDTQRDASDACLLRQQLEASCHAEAALQKQLAVLQQQLAASGGSSGSGGVAGGDDASPRSSGSSTRGGSTDASPPRSVGRPAGAAALQGRLDGLARELSATRQELARLQADRDRLRDELDARDTEVMQLQGQLSMLQAAAANDADNWLSPLPDPM